MLTVKAAEWGLLGAGQELSQSESSTLIASSGPILTHGQLSPFPEGQPGRPDGHAEVDATVHRLHVCEIEETPVHLPPHS